VSGPVPASGRATTGPPPEGTLDDYPLPVIFTHALSHRLSGSLVLKGPYGDDVVVFADGAPARIRTAKMIAPLGEMLVRLGVIADVDLQAALFRAQSAHAKLGKQLVSESLVDRRVLVRALREQILLRMRSLAALPPETAYEFHSNADLLEDGAPTNQVTCDALAALHAFVRAWPERRRIDEALAPFENAPVRIHPLATLDRFELDESERSVLARIRGKMTHAELLKSSAAPERSIRALLFTLHLTHHLDDGTGVEPLDVEPPSNPIASLRDSKLNTGIDPTRTSSTIKVLGAADDHREADALWRAGNLEAAEALAARAVDRDPQPPYKALLGVIIAQQGGRANYKRGIALLNEAIEAAPSNDLALVYRATVLRDAGRIDAAIRDWRAALAANPGNPEAKVALKRAEVHGDALRRSSMRLQRRSSRPPKDALTGWLVLAAIVIATIVLLTVYLRMRR
jgi:tetratricopeptide (TPR) repeat protein